MVGAAQGVEQQLLVGLGSSAASRRGAPRARACRPSARSGRAAGARRPARRSRRDAHQVAHRPARQAEQAQQPRAARRALDQQREVALRRRSSGSSQSTNVRAPPAGCSASRRACAARAHQAGQAELALVAQHADLRLVAERPHPRRQLRRGSCSRKPRRRSARRRAAAAAAVAGARAAAVVQQRVELVGDELARLAERGRAARTAPRTPRRSRLAAIQARSPSCSAARGSAGRRGTGCGARRGAGTRRRRPARSALSRFIRPPAASLSSAFRVERVRISGNWPPRTTSSSWTMNSISRIGPWSHGYARPR